jgi:hypothetical protein
MVTNVSSVNRVSKNYTTIKEEQTEF